MKKIITTLLLALWFLSPLHGQHLLWNADLSEVEETNISATKRGTDGNTYVIGQYKSTTILPLTGNLIAGDLFVAKISGVGKLLWKKRFTGTAHGFNLALDTKNNIIFTGAYTHNLIAGSIELTTPGSVFNAFTIKLNINGEVLWAINAGLGFGTGITIDAFDNIYAVGSSSFGNGKIIKYNSMGSVLLTKTINARTISDIALDNAGNIYLSGTCVPAATFDTVIAPILPGVGYFSFLIKYNPIGNAQWGNFKNYITFDYSNAISINGSHIYWLGSESHLPLLLRKVWKYNVQGNVLASTVVSTEFKIGTPNSITAMNNKVYVLNSRFNTLTLQCYNSTLILENVFQITNVFVKSSAISSLSSNINVAYSTVKTDGTFISEVKNFGAFNGRITTDAISPMDEHIITDSETDKELNVWPNPIHNNEEMHIDFTSQHEGKTFLTISDMNNNVIIDNIYHANKGMNSWQYNLKHLAGGMYTLKICVNKKCTSRNFIVEN
jgi:hypothetical protein